MDLPPSCLATTRGSRSIPSYRRCAVKQTSSLMFLADIHIMYHGLHTSDPSGYFPGVHLQCTTWALPALGFWSSVACLSTWQRGSGCSAKSGAIQAGRRRHAVNHTFLDMESTDDDLKRVPTFDGRLDQCPDYRKRALLYLNSLEDSRQVLAGHALSAIFLDQRLKSFAGRLKGFLSCWPYWMSGSSSPRNKRSSRTAWKIFAVPIAEKER